MRHAREDYNRIQDPAGLIPEDEPVFLLRAQDENAAALVYLWAEMAERGGVDPVMIRLADAQAKKMRAWRKHKKPDL